MPLERLPSLDSGLPVRRSIGAHVHAAEMVLQIVRQDAEQLIFVFSELFQPVARRLERRCVRTRETSSA